AGGVRRPQPFEHLYGDGIHLRRGEAPAVVDATAGRLAIHELHDHVALAVGELAEIEHLDDVLRPDAPRSLRFALETRDRITVGCDAGVEHFDGHAPVNTRVLALVDRTHATFAEQANDAVFSVDQVSSVELHAVRRAPLS